MTNYCCVRVADTFDAFFFTYEAFTGYCSANRKVSINEIGFCDNEIGFCVQTLDVLFGVTFVNIIKFAFGASSRDNACFAKGEYDGSERSLSLLIV